MDVKVFWSVLAALLVFVLLVAVVDAVRTQVAMRQLDAVFRSASPPPPRLSTYTLNGTTQQCLRGQVWHVEGALSTQVLVDGRPVRCRGLVAHLPR